MKVSGDLRIRIRIRLDNSPPTCSIRRVINWGDGDVYMKDICTDIELVLMNNDIVFLPSY
jgi:hypothetical protein